MIPGPWRIVFPCLAVSAGLQVHPASAQVSIALQGGVHAARLDRPERVLFDPGGPIAIEGAKGEARMLGLRLGTWFSDRWGLDGGVAWSSNRSWQGSTTLPPPAFRTQTFFTSATLRARLTSPASRWGLVAGAGPALIFHGGTGTSLLARSTDLGGLLSMGGSVRVGSRMAFTLDAHEYLFGSRFVASRNPQFGPARSAGSEFRHEFALLAGVAWQMR
jgi:hypothetical protein